VPNRLNYEREREKGRNYAMSHLMFKCRLVCCFASQSGRNDDQCRFVSKIALVVAITIVTVITGGCEIFRSPKMGKCTDSWVTENNTFRIRVNKHAEEHGGFNPGAYFVFQSAPKGQENWKEVIVFRHDDPVDIPRQQVRFVSDSVGYFFMGNKFAVTTDGGMTWSVWDAMKNLPDWTRTRADIKDVQINVDGSGTMQLISPTNQEVPILYTRDYGKTWQAK
jgi:BNR/Asp-box repeat